MSETKRLIETCARIENVVAGIYDFLAEHHRENRQMSRLWKKTADEERNHELQFKMAEKLYFSSATVKTGPIDLTRAQTALEKVTQVREYFVRNPPTVAFALDKMIAMEEALSGFHASTTLVFGEEAHRRLFEAMMGSDDGHIESLRKVRVLLAVAPE